MSEYVAISTRDGFLYTFPVELVSHPGYVWKDMMDAYDALHQIDAPTPTPTSDDGASSSSDPPPPPSTNNRIGLTLTVDTNATSMEVANWCIIDKKLNNKYKKEDIAGKIIAKYLETPEAIHEARVLAFEANI